MSKIFKKHTKRVLCKKRYKIEKKIREHNRKVKKQHRKNPHKSTKPKDIGVPNSLPFKELVLKEIAETKIKVEESHEKRKEEVKNERMRSLGLEGFEDEAKKRADEFAKKEEEPFNIIENKYKPEEQVDKSAYIKEFQKVVDASDVILEVLDARDPMGTRCPTLERAVINASTDKKLVLVINKIDLVPRENLIKWLKYLRKYFPTIPFKASTQTQKFNRHRIRGLIIETNPKMIETRACLGADGLMRVLGCYSRSGDIRKSITVGIVGFPNVGKSSIINSLKRRKSCKVGAIPGITKFKQEIRLDKHIRLLDSPGVIFAPISSDASDAEKSAAALKNAIVLSALKDTFAPAETIIRRANKEQIMRFYNLPDFKDPREFLYLFAKRIGRLKKGGVPDIKLAAKILLRDWNYGKIKYFTETPEELDDNSGDLGATIVEKLSQPFDMEELFNDQENELRGLKVILPSEGVLVTSYGETEAADITEENMEDAAEKMEQDLEATGKKTIVNLQITKKKNDVKKEKQRLKSSRVQVPTGLKHHESEAGDQLNKSQKQKFKQMKRRQKRSEKLATKLSDSLSTSMNLETKPAEPYNFEADFK